MLEAHLLKRLLHKKFTQLEKLLIILAASDEPLEIGEMRKIAANAGLTIDKGWNPSSSLARSGGLAIKLPSGWEITEEGQEHLRGIGVDVLIGPGVEVATALRSKLGDISDEATRAFAEEAIRCFENKLFRSAIVMSWIAAVDVLHKTVASEKLKEFNAEAKRVSAKWKPAKNADDLGRMGEDDFLQRCASIGILGKNRKEELLKCLKLRNGCGHPNSLKIGPHTAASHLEILLLNVFSEYPV